ncbi:nuclear transport factor 2 family protein [Allosalinactinospora lopnorensis]|uniref:nuclear transport factor 2 family protein n=1 Tax=Allosalinactinospora lopnorensis TaxID=1352348 RepID=UPI000623C891|nr:nuclear transport factor 2 family protein [Allosalinactinospora lopnorensis]
MDSDNASPDAERAACEAAVAGELRLLDPAVRDDPAAAGALLDSDFTEIGRSGRWWTRDAILAALPGMDAEGGPGAPEGMSARVLAPGLVHLTYTVRGPGRDAARSSLWRRGADGTWRMLFHQATPLP